MLDSFDILSKRRRLDADSPQRAAPHTTAPAAGLGVLPPAVPPAVAARQAAIVCAALIPAPNDADSDNPNSDSGDSDVLDDFVEHEGMHDAAHADPELPDALPPPPVPEVPAPARRPRSDRVHPFGPFSVSEVRDVLSVVNRQLRLPTHHQDRHVQSVVMFDVCNG